MALRVQTDVGPVDSAWSRPLPSSQTLIATGDFSATDPKPVEFTPPIEATQVMLVLDITAQTGAGNTVTFNVELWDPAKAAFVAMGTAPTFAAGGASTNKVIVTPYLAAAAGPPVVIQCMLGATLRVRPVGSGTRTLLAYTVSAHFSE